MKNEKWVISATVRDGYQVLLRAEARAELPTEYGRIALYYRTLGEKCIAWATEVYGERLKKEFLALQTIRERSSFGCGCYRFEAGSVWEAGEDLIAFVCDSTLTGVREGHSKRFHRRLRCYSCYLPCKRAWRKACS